MYRIVNLKAENYLRLKAIDITPDPDKSVIYLTGKNGAGKSSVLKAIWAAFENKALSKDVISPIREGEESGSVTIDLGDLKVTRTWTQSDSYLKVEGANGKISSPQKLLDTLKSSLTFDPMVFIRETPKEQRETLIKLLGVDTDSLDVKRQALFNERTIENRREKELKSQIDGFRIPEGTPDEPVKWEGLIQEIREAEQRNSRLNVVKISIQEIETAIEALKTQIFDKTETLNRFKTELGTLPGHIDTAELESQLSGAETTNAAVEQKRQQTRLKGTLAETQAKTTELTHEIEQIDKDKKALLKSVEFPVEGLSFNSDGVLWQGIPLSQASSSEQIRVSLAMGMAMQPDLRIMMIQDGSLLDNGSRAVVEQMARDHDMQVWCEVVDESGESAIIIEDGEVKQQQV